ncbi:MULTISPECIES: AbrB/MazE/SpoVT family DNA-binding domain-containing protein [Dictyoglomus]|jgi:AbrB family looped-hinge helix DNA binding protein|uniref:Transcriptional regulator, AbrB family n=1 Tax=Dictyoglomus turgidum (strain DSM 6724 / Z-1310) TaxID=515635 RepID=B8DYL6_DICTD|nr:MULTISPECIES: AbrB/MazE/SpoVT family DNA-binding domain-containing protein [Dictyoglomus]ACK41398.1 transcriptional regulator, AbrB family [Dictyoglomus turgidum DSM 6724]PNV80931.1 MAG: AbrB family transcriptional regulator [Dictyoglomus turgidum]HBU31597.1 AbrB family transcriptional regulator [Dictyoglomus sp.]
MNRKIYGMATLSERGQIVIPQEAREDLDLKPGDKLIVMCVGPKNALMLVKSDSLLELFSELTKELSELEKFISNIKEAEKE